MNSAERFESEARGRQSESPSVSIYELWPIRRQSNEPAARTFAAAAALALAGGVGLSGNVGQC